jgi:hypothetical protein
MTPGSGRLVVQPALACQTAPKLIFLQIATAMNRLSTITGITAT